MNREDRYRGQDPDDQYAYEADEYSTGDEMTDRGSAQSMAYDDSAMRQEQGGQGYGQGAHGYQDEPGYASESYPSDMDGMHGAAMSGRRAQQDEEDELYGNQLDDFHEDDEESEE